MRNLVDPDLLPGLEIMPQFDLNDETLPAIREGMEQMTAMAPEPEGTGVTWREDSIETPDGRRLRLRIYVPGVSSAPLPGIFHIHGGGYVAGSLATSHGFNMLMAAAVEAVVVSVDYRLAPETRAPGSVEDCYAAFCWLHQHAAQLGVDPARIAVRGESAGGGLAAALTQLVRDRGGPAIIHQNLIYPMLDDRTCITRQPDHLGAFVWTPEANSYGWRSLLGQAPGAAEVPPYAVPARAANLADLPPAFIAVGALDVFLAEDLDYTRRLIEAGVATELHVYPRAYHGFDVVQDAPASVRMREDAFAALRRAFA